MTLHTDAQVKEFFRLEMMELGLATPEQIERVASTPGYADAMPRWIDYQEEFACMAAEFI